MSDSQDTDGIVCRHWSNPCAVTAGCHNEGCREKSGMNELRERLARIIDPEAFSEYAMTWVPGPGDFPSNWENRRTSAQAKADLILHTLIEAPTLAAALTENQ